MDALVTVSNIQIIYHIACLSHYVIDRKTRTLKESKLLEIYSLIIIIVSVAIMLSGIILTDEYIKTNDDDLGQVVAFIQMLSVRAAHTASIAEALFRRKEENNIYQEITHIDCILERSLNVDINNIKFRRNTTLLALLMAITFFAAEIFTLIYKENCILFWILYLIPSLICSMKYFEIFTSMRILKYRFDLLVNVLRKITFNAGISAMEGDLIVNSVGNIETLLNDKYCVDLCETPIYKTRCCDKENDELNKLLFIRAVYNRLFHLSEMFNNYFGFSLLFNVGNDFIRITSNCYLIFNTFADFYMNENDFLKIAGSFVWSLPQLMNIAVLALLCDKTVKKTNKIALYLHRININIWNDDHNTVIEQFSLQLLHQKMSITAAGFFDIDCTLLYTIVGATATYLIILIQFQMNDS